MIIKSQFADIDYPKCDILTYLFPKDRLVSKTPLWYDAVDPTNHLSPFEALQYIKRLGLGLDKLNFGYGDIVIIYSPNHILIPAAYLGIVGNSRAFSAINPISTHKEVVNQLQNSEAKCMLVHPSLVDKAIAAAEEAGLPKSRIFQFDTTACQTFDGVPDWRELLARPDEVANYQWKALSEEAAAKTIATVNYSSGTTGLPKGVCISHRNVIAQVEQVAASTWPGVKVTSGEDVDERWICFLPLYHAYGQIYANLLALKCRIPTYVMKQFDFEALLHNVQKYRITTLQVVPPILVMMNKRPETSKYDLSSLKRMLSGGAPLSKELQTTISKKFNVAVKQGWGMTELVTGALIQFTAETQGNVGQLIPNCECKLIDDDGNEVGYDTPGEICIRGPNVCLGYFKNEAATKETITEDGWLKSGDIAVVDRNGVFRIVDRKKELIKVNARQVAPAELEAVLLENPDIADAAVVGITIDNDEWPRAYVVVAPSSKGRVTSKDIQTWVAEKVAKYKRLVGGVEFVDAVPRLASGKIQRKVVREWAKRDVASVKKMLEQNSQAKL